MRRIRIGNEFTHLWVIERLGEPENLNVAIDIVLLLKTQDGTSKAIDFETVNGNIVRVRFTKSILNRLADYSLVLEYYMPDDSMPNGVRHNAVNQLMFTIVGKTEDADADVDEFTSTSDVAIGLRGADAYEVWQAQTGNAGKTYEEYIAYLREPLTDAVQEIEGLNEELTTAENARKDAENGRVSWYNGAVIWYNAAVNAISTALTNIATAISGANTAATNANTVATNVADAETERVSWYNSFVAWYNDAVSSIATALGNIANAIYLSNTATSNANTAADLANEKAGEVADVIELSNTATSNANAKAILADTAATNANTVATNVATAEAARVAAGAEVKANKKTVINPLSETEYLNSKGVADYVTTKVLTTEEKEIALHNPFGLKYFQVYDPAKFELVGVKDDFKLKGDFTHFRHASVANAVNLQLFTVFDNSGNSIRVSNEAYTFRIRLKINNIETIYFEQPSINILPNGLNAIIYTQVDFLKSRIVIQYSTFEFIFAITDLALLKDVVFNNINLGIASYLGTCQYSFIVNALYPISLSSKIFNTNNSFLLNVLSQKSVNTAVLTAPPEFSLGGNIKSFLNGSVFYSASELAALTVGNNIYSGHRNISVDLTKYRLIDGLSSYIRYSYSLKVENASIFLAIPSTFFTHIIRLKNKNNSTILEYIAPTGYSQYEIPVGEWIIEIVGEAKGGYNMNALNLVQSWGKTNFGATLTVYNDLKINLVGVVLSAFPKMASANIALCPFSGQLIKNGIWNLTD